MYKNNSWMTKVLWSVRFIKTTEAFSLATIKLKLVTKTKASAQYILINICFPIGFMIGKYD